MSTDGFLLPEPDEVTAPFWEGCTAGVLRVQACRGCGRRRFPPRPMCPWCQSLDVHWEVMSGRGRVWSFVVAHPPLLPAYGDQAPYNVVVVELADDPQLRVVGNVVSEADAPLDSVDPRTIEIGDAVRVVFTTPVDGIAFPRWVRAGQQ